MSEVIQTLAFDFDGDGIGVSDLKSEISELSKPQINVGLFKMMTGNDWIEQAKNRPIPKMLFSQFWHEGELCILFADTNLGKSILAVQIGDAISKGVSIQNFILEAEKQTVLYYDFELSDKQFENRYSEDYTNHYRFNDNFIRIELDPDASILENQTFESYLYQSLEQSIIESGAKILIIDNITYLKSATETAKDALPLMKELKSLKSKYELSILALAHTPKRNLSMPITRNDLQGSKMIINFCDSSFTIGESHSDKSVRYLKQIKQRNTEQIFDSENVITCQIGKVNSFLGFEFINYGSETEHLKQRSDSDKADLETKVFELKKQGKSLRDIGVELGISHMKVSRILK
ncbi:hypothetical protein Flavo103_08520 [Flavobacterium collinsii]|uniref:AAA family ATPase n=1 Tax=Flavobacterium collinsii TaxID=1114861 RepID=UPI0022CCDF44|nr:AAA family ATPase [Flavobacterium collinsii]GIQ57716.1 hypothetical protein Flavo103_08520 [Flavobacterium collinsii]